MRKIFFTLFALIMITALISCSPDATGNNVQTEGKKQEQQVWEETCTPYTNELKKYGITRDNVKIDTETGFVYFDDLVLIPDAETFLKTCNTISYSRLLLTNIDVPYQEVGTEHVTKQGFLPIAGEIYLNDHKLTLHNIVDCRNVKNPGYCLLKFYQVPESLNRSLQEMIDRYPINIVDIELPAKCSEDRDSGFGIAPFWRYLERGKVQLESYQDYGAKGVLVTLKSSCKDFNFNKDTMEGSTWHYVGTTVYGVLSKEENVGHYAFKAYYTAYVESEWDSSGPLHPTTKEVIITKDIPQ